MIDMTGTLRSFKNKKCYFKRKWQSYLNKNKSKTPFPGAFLKKAPQVAPLPSSGQKHVIDLMRVSGNTSAILYNLQ